MHMFVNGIVHSTWTVGRARITVIAKFAVLSRFCLSWEFSAFTDKSSRAPTALSAFEHHIVPLLETHQAAVVHVVVLLHLHMCPTSARERVTERLIGLANDHSQLLPIRVRAMEVLIDVARACVFINAIIIVIVIIFILTSSCV